MRFAIVGGTIHGNRGAEAMVATTIGRIRDRYPEASILLLTYFPEADRDLLGDRSDIRVIGAKPTQVVAHLFLACVMRLAETVRIPIGRTRLFKAVSAIRQCDGLFDVSGIAFHDGRLAVVAYNVLCVLPAMILGVPVMRLSQAMGPFERLLNRLPARFVVNHSLHTFVRGEASATHMRGLGVDEAKWSIAADVAFAYRDQDSLTSEHEDLVDGVHAELDESSGRLAAIVPSSLVLQKSQEESTDYIGILLGVVATLQHEGYHVLVLPNATRQGNSSLRNNDIAAITQMMDRVGVDPQVNPRQLTKVDFDLNTRSIRSLVARCELLLTSRFHTMVAGLALDVPTLVLGWSHKYEEVMEMFDCADLAVDYTNPRALHGVLADVLEHRAQIQGRIASARPTVTESSESQFAILERIAR